MEPIKCIGCLELKRTELNLVSGKVVVYKCHRYFPYMCALSGLLRPGKGIVEAVKDCPERLDEHCILCSSTILTTFGLPPLVFICPEHDKAWGKWLDDHPGKHEYFAPGHRVKKDRWIEVFREFIEDMRPKAGREKKEAL